MKKLVFLTILLICQFLIAQEKKQLYKQVQHQGDIESSVHILNYLALRHYGRQADSALFYAQKALAMSQRIDYKSGAVGSQAAILLSLHQMDSIEDATAQINSLLQNDAINDQAKRSAYYALHGIYYPQVQLDSCIKYSEQMLRLSKRIDPIAWQANFHNKLGVDYLKKGYTDLALKEMLASLRIANTLPDNTLNIFNTNMNISIAYEYANKPKGAIKHMEVGYKMARELDDPAKICFSTVALASGLINLNKYDEANTVLEEYDQLIMKYPEASKNFLVTYYMNKGNYNRHIENTNKALEYYRKVIDLSRARGDKHGLMMFHSTIADVYLDRNEITKAEEEIGKAEEIQKDISDLLRQKTIYKIKAKADSLKGDVTSYMKNHWNFLKLKDSLASQEVENTIAQLNVEYETELKDNEIKLLLAENELKEAQQKNMSIWQIGLTILAGLLLILVFVLYRGYRNKQKSLKIIQHKNKENKLLVKETHHRVKNNLQIISSLLSAQHSTFSNDNNITQMIQESQNRIKSLALIHEELYQNEKMIDVNAKFYFQQLIKNVSISFSSRDKNIEIEQNIQDTIINNSIAIPLGLILNELLTNCYKYAFTNREKGIVDISFYETNGSYTLAVADNGIGIENTTVNKNSFGLELIEGLTNQFDGEFTKSSEDGTRFEITLRDPYLIKVS